MAFVVDVFSRRIVGWRVSNSMHTDFVLDALEEALDARQPDRDKSLVHHSDRGWQLGFKESSQRRLITQQIVGDRAPRLASSIRASCEARR